MKTRLDILITDDDRAHRVMLKKLLNGWGYNVTEADDGLVAVEKVRKSSFDLILMDIRMTNVSGIEALEQIKQINADIPVIIMTAYASVETAVQTLKKGAYDYLTKPLDFDELQVSIARATEHSRLKKENEYLKEKLGEKFDRRNMIGQSPSMIKLLEVVEQVAATQATVLITGESGTGKEVIANAIHFNSARKNAPFVKINCAALTETLLESELFGHEKGAFTGADKRREGKFVQADGGSIFLDEVSEMSPAMQVKLLRVLQERELTRVGGHDVLKIDVRVIAASNKDLKKEIRDGRFREDLFYRLNVVTLDVPPLRERSEDIPLMAHAFLKMFAENNAKVIKGFTPQAMQKLASYSWPGNVRELMNAVERAVVLCRTETIGEEDLIFTMADQALSREVLSAGQKMPAASGNRSLEEIEKQSILEALQSCRGNKSEAARRLGITRKTLRKRLHKYEDGE
ncbi:MAG TPA: sigma-54 dependent transcriptional regulator [Smithella sp.]|jgi:two-component system response regulator HydG|nr:sigma-54-dependent Fis family transcriptional regulator [Smithella sp.]HOE32063.1 sigma-54 dependent transcriptional regulator [Smithella sp.]HOO34576.1 sigma-54 dependent transcriptional regulator [Smithella sp.]HOX98167.1 sigma-54 dependent transcriptional regulator [Smithella sp.]HPC08051.1 sigma-54 dependent transcriptional regulator [Smithella sp.]